MLASAKRLWRILAWRYQRFQLRRSPQANVLWGFFVYTLLGAALLCIPWFHNSSVALVDNVFIATSAVSTTGLLTVGLTESYNFGGQLVVLLLIQIGGVGYMTLTTYFLLFTTRRITHWHRNVMGAEFTLPRSININDFIRSAVVFTLVMEVLGAAVLAIGFHKSGMPTEDLAWNAIFHSVSAFCTAGFALFNDSFTAYAHDPWIIGALSGLALAGSLGFIVITDVWLRLRGKVKRLSFTTKIVVVGTLALLTAGTLALAWLEPSLSQSEGVWALAFFQAMSAMTTVGFNTADLGTFGLPVLLMTTFLMYVGASPSGTAGGMKITTLTAMLAVLKSRLRGQREISFLNRRIPFERLYVATSTFVLYTSVVAVAVLLLGILEPLSLHELLFETASALGTVGLSTGITPELSTPGKLLIVCLMFAGRVGVLTFGFALLHRQSQSECETEEDLAV